MDLQFWAMWATQDSISGSGKSFFQNYHTFFDTSKCAENYVISFEVYDGLIGQKILKLMVS